MTDDTDARIHKLAEDMAAAYSCSLEEAKAKIAPAFANAGRDFERIRLWLEFDLPPIIARVQREHCPPSDTKR